MTSFIKNVTFDCANPRRVATFWAAATGYQPAFERDDLIVLSSPDERGVRQLLFNAVPESKVAKNRVHIDLAATDPAAEVNRLVGLGATKVEECQGDGISWTVLLDPEGNEFCLG